MNFKLSNAPVCSVTHSTLGEGGGVLLMEESYTGKNGETKIKTTE